jgi:hypothetical protein
MTGDSDPTDRRPATESAAAAFGGEWPDGGADPRPRLAALVLGVVLVAVAIVGLIDVRTDPWLPLGARGSDPGPGFLPELLLWLLLAGGLAQIGSVALAARLQGGFAASDEFLLQRLWVPCLLFVSLVSYYWAIRSFGYLLPSVAFALVWVPIIHFRSGRPFQRRHLLQFPVEAILIAGALYTLFRYGIRVPLP